jgi:hypothetical protein
MSVASIAVRTKRAVAFRVTRACKWRTCRSHHSTECDDGRTFGGKTPYVCTRARLTRQHHARRSRGPPET